MTPYACDVIMIWKHTKALCAKDAIMEKLLNAYLLKETGDIEVEL